MKNWKKRIKRFLALWLKDELLEIVGLNNQYQPRTIIHSSDLKELKVDFVLNYYDLLRNNVTFHEVKQRVWTELFDEFVKYVEIESDTLLNPYSRDTRIIGSVFVGNRKSNS